MDEIKYHIKLDNFEGPLDLLLHLIKREKVDIYDIPLSKITEQYLAYMKIMKELNIEIAGEFIVMAAYLINLKSRRLLTPAHEEDEDEDTDQMKKELMEKLAEYQLFKKGGEVLLSKQKEQELFFTSPGIPGDQHEEENLDAVDLLELAKAFFNIMRKEKNEPLVHPIHIDPVDMKHEMRQLLSLLTNQKSYSFRHYCAQQKDVNRIAIIFIALLELIRLRRIVVKQRKIFGDIQMYLPM
ncbi:MAG: segregation and condensation protein A [bacterium]